ncbi:MAG: type II toxin-antitoxin system VapB family antitoxin [Kiritimatiellae bacterium]|nr:type II toxin-antitoxin system VapB family antitoxin [Kiritimatiellia bacterium]
MKMTMHIDEDLLKNVMEYYDFVTKTEAVHAALLELDRRRRYDELLNEPVEWGENELRDSVAPGYDPIAMRVAESSGYYGHFPQSKPENAKPENAKPENERRTD